MSPDSSTVQGIEGIGLLVLAERAEVDVRKHA
jgi:hypothetical protein